MEVIKRACAEGKCAPRQVGGADGAGGAGGLDMEDALAQAVKDTVDLLKGTHGGGGAAGGGLPGSLSEEDVMKQFTESLAGMEKDPNMAVRHPCGSEFRV